MGRLTGARSLSAFGGSIRSEFLEQVAWKQNWGGAFEDYRPLAQFAKDQHVPLQVDPPKSLIRQVVKQGLVQAKEQPEWRQWGMEERSSWMPTYRSRIFISTPGLP
ncbi:MAG: ChaN family lipoprotein, partial [Nitrospira sp.]|nr:ChaN family lipoprotein [Nitrospira sp.]